MESLHRRGYCLPIMKVSCKLYWGSQKGVFLKKTLLRFKIDDKCISTGNESNFRTAAYEAITSYLSHATPDAIGVVQNTAVTVLQRMEHLLSIQNQIVGVDDRNSWNELQSNLCGVLIVRWPWFFHNFIDEFSDRILQCVIRKLNEGIEPLAVRIMTLILQLIQSAGKTSTVVEDAFLVVGALASGEAHPFLELALVYLCLFHHF